LTEFMDLSPELLNFDEALDSVSRTGFGPGELHPKLRQYAIDDAMLSLKSRWLDRLSGIIASGPIGEWQKKAHDTKLHSDLPQWIADAMATLRHHCYAAGPRPPEEKTLETGPHAANFDRMISAKAEERVRG